MTACQRIWQVLTGHDRSWKKRKRRGMRSSNKEGNEEGRMRRSEWRLGDWVAFNSCLPAHTLTAERKDTFSSHSPLFILSFVWYVRDGLRSQHADCLTHFCLSFKYGEWIHWPSDVCVCVCQHLCWSGTLLFICFYDRVTRSPSPVLSLCFTLPSVAFVLAQGPRVEFLCSLDSPSLLLLPPASFLCKGKKKKNTLWQLDKATRCCNGRAHPPAVNIDIDVPSIGLEGTLPHAHTHIQYTYTRAIATCVHWMDMPLLQ